MEIDAGHNLKKKIKKILHDPLVKMHNKNHRKNEIFGFFIQMLGLVVALNALSVFGEQLKFLMIVYC